MIKVVATSRDVMGIRWVLNLATELRIRRTTSRTQHSLALTARTSHAGHKKARTNRWSKSRYQWVEKWGGKWSSMFQPRDSSICHQIPPSPRTSRSFIGFFCPCLSVELTRWLTSADNSARWSSFRDPERTLGGSAESARSRLSKIRMEECSWQSSMNCATFSAATVLSCVHQPQSESLTLPEKDVRGSPSLFAHSMTSETVTRTGGWAKST